MIKFFKNDNTGISQHGSESRGAFAMPQVRSDTGRVGGFMAARQLSPEACMDLQIHLDKLEKAGERCRRGLADLARGSLTRSAYMVLMQQFKDAQRDLDLRHAKYFVGLETAPAPSEQH